MRAYERWIIMARWILQKGSRTFLGRISMPALISTAVFMVWFLTYMHFVEDVDDRDVNSFAHTRVRESLEFEEEAILRESSLSISAYLSKLKGNRIEGSRNYKEIPLLSGEINKSIISGQKETSAASEHENTPHIHVCSIMNGGVHELAYMAEWIEFLRLQGVSSLTIYRSYTEAAAAATMIRTALEVIQAAFQNSGQFSFQVVDLDEPTCGEEENRFKRMRQRCLMDARNDIDKFVIPLKVNWFLYPSNPQSSILSTALSQVLNNGICDNRECTSKSRLSNLSVLSIGEVYDFGLSGSSIFTPHIHYALNEYTGGKAEILYDPRDSPNFQRDVLSWLQTTHKQSPLMRRIDRPDEEFVEEVGTSTETCELFLERLSSHLNLKLALDSMKLDVISSSQINWPLTVKMGDRLRQPRLRADPPSLLHVNIFRFFRVIWGLHTFLYSLYPGFAVNGVISDDSIKWMALPPMFWRCGKTRRLQDCKDHITSLCGLKANKFNLSIHEDDHTSLEELIGTLFRVQQRLIYYRKSLKEEDKKSRAKSSFPVLSNSRRLALGKLLMSGWLYYFPMITELQTYRQVNPTREDVLLIYMKSNNNTDERHLENGERAGMIIDAWGKITNGREDTVNGMSAQDNPFMGQATKTSSNLIADITEVQKGHLNHLRLDRHDKVSVESVLWNPLLARIRMGHGNVTFNHTTADADNPSEPVAIAKALFTPYDFDLNDFDIDFYYGKIAKQDNTKKTAFSEQLRRNLAKRFFPIPRFFNYETNKSLLVEIVDMYEDEYERQKQGRHRINGSVIDGIEDLSKNFDGETEQPDYVLRGGDMQGRDVKGGGNMKGGNIKGDNMKGDNRMECKSSDGNAGRSLIVRHDIRQSCSILDLVLERSLPCPRETPYVMVGSLDKEPVFPNPFQPYAWCASTVKTETTAARNIAHQVCPSYPEVPCCTSAIKVNVDKNTYQKATHQPRWRSRIPKLYSVSLLSNLKKDTALTTYLADFPTFARLASARFLPKNKLKK